MNTKKLLFGVLFALVFAFSFLISEGFAASDTLDANVTIGSLSEITVSPNIVNWTDVSLGAAAGNKTIIIENTGSVNVTNIYAYPDTLTDESVLPYGSSVASSYATGGVLTLTNNSIPQYFFLGRIEWNYTSTLLNLNTTNVASPTGWGFFKNASDEYVWAIGNGTNGYCNDTNSEFAIEDDLDQMTMETRTPDDTTITNNYQDVDYSYFSVSRGTSSLNGYCVAVSTDCSKIYIYKYDKRTGFTQCTNSRYISTNQHPPGNYTELGLNPYVPKGLPTGELSRATVTFVAT